MTIAMTSTHTAYSAQSARPRTYPKLGYGLTRTVILTPSEYLNLPESKRRRILSVRFQPPIIGRKGFGKMLVE